MAVTDSTSHKAALRAVVVFALAAVVLAYCLPDLRRLVVPEGDLGFVNDPSEIVTAIKPHSPAERAGMNVGDRIDVAATKPEYRDAVINATTSEPGQSVTFAVSHGTIRREVTLISDPEPMDPAKRTLIVLRGIALLLFIGIGAALVLLRPSGATWGFYFYCLGLNGATDSLAPMLFGPPWNGLIGTVQSGFYAAGFVGVAVFATLFLHEHPTGWRAMVYRAAPVVWLILAVVQALWYYLSENAASGSVLSAIVNAVLVIFGASVAVSMYAFIQTYVHALGSDRRRIRWVILGFGIALVTQVIDIALSWEGFNLPYWVHGTLELSGVVVPLTVAYAVIKHRIIDVSFVVSRALVYGVLTTLLVGAFSIVDWLFAEKLRLARLGTLVEMGVAVGAGFWFNNLHKSVDSFIDATFFRQRHRAERQLAQINAALPSFTTTRSVAEALVAEPARTLSLASAALFRKGKTGSYVREESEGWGQGDLARLDDRDDRLLALLQTERGPISLYDHKWRTEHVPQGPAQPALALPIIVRRELAAVVFYGAHVHGESLDPDEIKAIAGLASGAAAAYDHLLAESMKRENDAIRNEVESLRILLSEAQIQPT